MYLGVQSTLGDTDSLSDDFAVETDFWGRISLLKCKIYTEHMLLSSILLWLFQEFCLFPLLFTMAIFFFISDIAFLIHLTYLLDSL